MFFQLTQLISSKITHHNLDRNGQTGAGAEQDRERHNIISDAGIVGAEDTSNEKELRLDYRIKVRMNELMDEFGVDEALDSQQSRFNAQHVQISLQKLDESLKRGQKRFMSDEEKRLGQRFKSRALTQSSGPE